MCTITVLECRHDGGLATMYMTGGPKSVYVYMTGSRGFTRCFNYRIGMPSGTVEIEATAVHIAGMMGLRGAVCRLAHTVECTVQDDRGATLVLDRWVAPAARL